MMILGAVFSCLDPVLSVVSYLEHKSPFMTTGRMLELKDAVDRLSSNTMSDHLTVANIMATWDAINSRASNRNQNEAYDFTSNNMLFQSVLYTLDKIKSQLASDLHKAGLIKSPSSKV